MIVQPLGEHVLVRLKQKEVYGLQVAYVVRIGDQVKIKIKRGIYLLIDPPAEGSTKDLVVHQDSIRATIINGK